MKTQTYLCFEGLISNFYLGSLGGLARPVGEDVAQELPVDAGHGGRLPVHVQAGAQLGYLTRDEAGSSTGT